MPRKGFIPRREATPDPKYDSVLVTRFVNAIMSSGKRSLAERAFYGAMTMVEAKTGQDAMTVLAPDRHAAPAIAAFTVPPGK